MDQEEKKPYDPDEVVDIPLTREQWHKVLKSLENDANQHHASMTQWLANCVDRVFGSETARRYELAYTELDALHAYIEKILIPTPELPNPGE